MLGQHVFDHDVRHDVLEPAESTLQSHLLRAIDREHARHAFVADRMTARPRARLVLAAGHGTDTSATAVWIVVGVATRA